MKGAFFYVDAGKGHFTPATALCDSFKAQGNEGEVINIFKVAKSPFWNWYCKDSWRFQLHHPGFENILNTIWDTHFSAFLMKMIVKYHHSMNKEFMKWYTKEQPDFLLCTNFLGGIILPGLIAKNHLNIPSYVYAADVFNNPTAGTNKKITKLYIPTELGRENAIKNGQLPEQVTLCPFPLKMNLQEFKAINRIEARRKLGLNENKFTVLLNLGGEGIGETSLVKELAKLNLDFQIIVLGNLSVTTTSKYKRFAKNNPNFDIILPGFVNNIGDYICACDIQAGKAGANSLMESLYLERPFLISQLLYAAHATLDFFKKHNVGWVENNVVKQAMILKQYKESAEEQKQMAENLAKLKISFDTMAFCTQIVKDTHKFAQNHTKRTF